MSAAAKHSYDLVVIGSGPAGQRAALQGAKAGKRVAIVDLPALFGGGCVHDGTLPSKSFRESVYRYSLGSRGTLGREADHIAKKERKAAVLPDMARLLRRRDRVVAGEMKIIAHQLERNKIRVHLGRARLVSPNEVEIDGGKGKERLTGSFIVVAVGARPVAPAHLAIDGRTVVDSSSILSLRKIPRTLIVLGAGIIGCEYASMFATAGTRVYLVDRRNEILSSVDREIVNHLVERFTTQGVEVLLGCEALRIDRRAGKDGSAAKVHLSNGRKIACDVALVSQGRFGNTEGLGLEQVGVERDERGLIKVDRHFRTTVPTVYAVGDVIGPPALASTSIEQGRAACRHAFGLGEPGEDGMPTLFPYGIYTIPEISTLGPSEEDLVARKADFVAGKGRYRELARGQIIGDDWGLLKLLVDRQTLKLLGVHIVGDNAADLIHIGQAVMAFGGDVHYFIKSVFNYPTLAEAYKTAAFHAVNLIKGTTTMK